MTSFGVSRKRIFRMAAIIPALMFAMFASPAAHAWGCQGHETVAMIAEMHMNPQTLAKVNQILKASPIDPALNRYCNVTGLTPMADVSTWADDIRSARPDASAWHYIDIPRGGTLGDIQKSCPEKEGCITKALQTQVAILRAASSTTLQRADALRFIIHFMGDIHQPLHDTTNNDRGGNCIPVEFFGTEPAARNPQSESYSPNLHSVWDSSIVGRMAGDKTVQQFAAEVDLTKIPESVVDWSASSSNPFEMLAWDVHELAESAVYGNLPHPIPIEKPVEINSCADDNHVGTRMLALHEDLEQAYQDATAPIVKQQLKKAGVSLANLLAAEIS
jgi:S1/P1 Nuclease